MEMPSFNLNKSTDAFETDEELIAAEEQVNSPRYFEPGRYDLQISEARFTRPCADPQWYGFQVTLKTGNDDDQREIRSFHQVPTCNRPYYQKPGGKKTLFVWTNSFKPFMEGLGEVVKQSTLIPLLQRYFVGDAVEKSTCMVYDQDQRKKVETPCISLKKLVGRKLTVDIGYPGVYIDKVPGSEEYGLFKNGVIVVKEGVELKAEDRAECQLLATEHDITITRLEILKIIPGTYVPTKSEVDDL